MCAYSLRNTDNTNTCSLEECFCKLSLHLLTHRYTSVLLVCVPPPCLSNGKLAASQKPLNCLSNDTSISTHFLEKTTVLSICILLIFFPFSPPSHPLSNRVLFSFGYFWAWLSDIRCFHWHAVSLRLSHVNQEGKGIAFPLLSHSIVAQECTIVCPSDANGHLDCFPVLAVTGDAATVCLTLISWCHLDDIFPWLCIWRVARLCHTQHKTFRFPTNTQCWVTFPPVEKQPVVVLHSLGTLPR
jgi:hypothetical protein